MDAENVRPNLIVMGLRWIAVIPASIAAFLAVAIVFWFVQRLFSWGEGALVHFLDTLWNGFLGGGAWVLAGAYTAPVRKKFPVAVAMGILLMLIIGATFFGLVIAPKKPENSWLAVLQLIMSLAGAGTAVHSLKDE